MNTEHSSASVFLRSKMVFMEGTGTMPIYVAPRPRRYVKDIDIHRSSRRKFVHSKAKHILLRNRLESWHFMPPQSPVIYHHFHRLVSPIPSPFSLVYKEATLATLFSLPSRTKQLAVNVRLSFIGSSKSRNLRPTILDVWSYNSAR